MKLNQSPRLNADAALIRELREHAQQVNALSEGRMAARYTASTAAPTTGQHAQGDFVHNSAPTVNTFTGSVIHGWLCTVGGIPGSWAECSYLANAPTATAWTAPTLLNSWVNFGSRFNDAGYIKDANGFVHLRGLIKSGTTTVETAFFNLPSGFRPSSEYIFTTSSNNLYGQARVKTDGDVTFHVGSNAWFSLDGISFKAA